MKRHEHAPLREIARALGGDVDGRSVLAPGPGHSAKDRSLSVTPSATAPDGFIVHSYASDDWQDCRDHVRARLGLSPFKPESAPRTTPQPPKEHDEISDKREAAKWLWECRGPVTDDCPAGLYLRQTRGYHGLVPPTLSYLPANGKHPPAMIAAFGFCDEPEPGVITPPPVVIGVHLTRLTMQGDKAPIHPVKIMLGPTAGLQIVLAPVNDGLGLAITEGIEDGLSVFEETGLSVWAAGSAGNMSKIAAALPPYVESATIFAHRDEAGMRGAKEAAQLIAAMEVEVHIKGRG